MRLYNTPLEAGLRSVVILEAFAPRAFDLTTLSLLDYFVVHTEDIGGPRSVHPELSSRKGEYYVRREIVCEGVELMVRGFVLERQADENGIAFRARETATAMIDIMNTKYNESLRAASLWLAAQAKAEGVEGYLEELRNDLGRWFHEVVESEAP